MVRIGECMENASNQAVEDIQRLVDDMKTVPQFASYVKMHRLASIDSNLADIDRMLDSGMLKD
jgi:hypothetical protein